jgi:hypothetical protein
MRLPSLCRQIFLGSTLCLAPWLHGATATAKPSDEECTAFGRQLAELVATGRGQELVNLLDRTELLNRIVTGMGMSESDERDFRQGMSEGITGNLSKQYATFTSARFLRLQKVDNETRALVRMVSEEGAANYTAFICFRGPNGALRWADAYPYLSGQTMAQSSRQAALPLIAQSKKGLLERLTQTESAYVTNFSKIHQASQALQTGDAARVWKLCETFPAELQKDRTVLILRLRAAQALDDAKYLKVIGDWESAFPNDSTLDFVSIDGAILRKDYPAALKHVTAFSKQIGGDTYLDYLTANVLVMAKRYDEARKTARAVLVAEPTLTEAFDTLLSISLETKNHVETVSVLDEIQQRFPTIDLEKQVVATEPYAEFRLSKAHQEWVAGRKAATKKAP